MLYQANGETWTTMQLPFFIQRTRFPAWKAIGAFGLSLFIFFLHFITPIEYHHYHLIFDRLFYLPVILAAFWFGLWGGVILGVFNAVLHGFHILFQWGGHFFHHNFYQTLEVFVHIFLGGVTGFLSERFIRTSEQLEHSYQELRDKTEQILNAEEQLRRTERIQALAELSAGVAHEIRTPLSSIKGAAEILTSPDLTQEQRHEFAQIVSKESRHLNHVVSEFLDFARPKPQTPMACDIEQILDSVLELVSQQLSLHAIQVEKNIEPDLPHIVFDTAQLKQVFANLIINAIQFMTEKGTICITCRRQNSNKIICNIEDSGPGIPDEVLPKIFNPFYTTRPNGTGLGLSIVQKILQHHNSSLSAGNRPEGGAIFSIMFSIQSEGDS